jgi:hypothetical protein
MGGITEQGIETTQPLEMGAREAKPLTVLPSPHGRVPEPASSAHGYSDLVRRSKAPPDGTRVTFRRRGVSRVR